MALQEVSPTKLGQILFIWALTSLFNPTPNLVLQQIPVIFYDPVEASPLGKLPCLPLTPGLVPSFTLLLALLLLSYLTDHCVLKQSVSIQA